MTADSWPMYDRMLHVALRAINRKKNADSLKLAMPPIEELRLHGLFTISAQEMDQYEWMGDKYISSCLGAEILDTYGGPVRFLTYYMVLNLIRQNAKRIADYFETIIGLFYEISGEGRTRSLLLRLFSSSIQAMKSVWDEEWVIFHHICDPHSLSAAYRFPDVVLTRTRTSVRRASIESNPSLGLSTALSAMSLTITSQPSPGVDVPSDKSSKPKEPPADSGTSTTERNHPVPHAKSSHRSSRSYDEELVSGNHTTYQDSDHIPGPSSRVAHTVQHYGRRPLAVDDDSYVAPSHHQHTESRPRDHSGTSSRSDSTMRSTSYSCSQSSTSRRQPYPDVARPTHSHSRTGETLRRDSHGSDRPFAHSSYESVRTSRHERDRSSTPLAREHSSTSGREPYRDAASTHSHTRTEASRRRDSYEDDPPSRRSSYDAIGYTSRRERHRSPTPTPRESSSTSRRRETYEDDPPFRRSGYEALEYMGSRDRHRSPTPPPRGGSLCSRRQPYYDTVSTHSRTEASLRRGAYEDALPSSSSSYETLRSSPRDRYRSPTPPPRKSSRRRDPYDDDPPSRNSSYDAPGYTSLGDRYRSSTPQSREPSRRSYSRERFQIMLAEYDRQLARRNLQSYSRVAS
ncbi:hypothetical protein PLICRDRAFT_689849 [Plicaturopsis crispa FD-325 SS-3]|nr:hypothetical protein PLICRDRAFT_689849 [Plicaturopsis crispa FD-325 SS-3]